ncbi:MAG: adenosylcobinamide-GDP ribazoletransferase [Methanophagales archaeon]|nr:adenosylcobinamide-GDP ribazoletransferase [Methanophagales archaeon]
MKIERLEDMRDLISFLTQIPVKKVVNIDAVTVNSHLFPFVGLLIGLIVAVVAFIVFGFLVVAVPARAEIAALLTLLVLYLLTGLLHIDGLADFSDGLMAQGSRAEKRRAMKDAKIGIAGLFAVIILLLLSLSAIETVGAEFISTVAAFDFNLLYLDPITVYDFAAVFIIAEVSAKLSMNTCMVLALPGKGFVSEGKNGAGNGNENGAVQGMGTLFIRSFSVRKYIAALLSAVLIAVLFTASFYFIIVFTGVIVAFFLSYVARQNFGAISGDVMGASNELARCVTLIIFAVF